ncbi:hypothetical protein KS4_10920 [Poriferisphaera corsica]|uniref:Uncharacterized protein n=1 Tax=Poriferisphaera corsica TaxID=2528020 RepID=A0A517YS61_9BACT|nr:hypothetical protein [Poriferisphaera corsica]QDU33051.1 hypothetical protein KS4_10920 [Poriferisphaera corsica]
MDLTKFFEMLTELMDSGVGITLTWLGAVIMLFWLSSKFNPFQEKWKQWEGTIITAIKMAEKEIPDNTPNRGLAKLDTALRYVLKTYSDINRGKPPSAKTTQQIKEGIQIKHSELQRSGELSKTPVDVAGMKGGHT